MKNQTTKINNKEEEKKRLLFIKRYNSTSDKNGKIIGQIKNYLKQNTVLELSDKIKLNKLETLKGPRFDKNKNLIPYSYVGPDRYFIIHRREAIKNVKNISPIFKHLSKKEKINKEKSDMNINSKIFKTFANKILFNKNIEIEKKIDKPLPKFMKAKLQKQEKILKRLYTYENIQNNIENLILKKTKKNKSNILMQVNKINNSMNRYIKTEDINANLKNWNFILRNPKIHGKYKRQGYFKATSLNEDLFSIINLNKNKKFFPTNKISAENLNYLKLEGKNILEKRISNQRKANKNVESNSNAKLNNNKNSKENFSFYEKTDRNLFTDYDEKVFVLNYNYTSKYNKQNREMIYF